MNRFGFKRFSSSALRGLLNAVVRVFVHVRDVVVGPKDASRTSRTAVAPRKQGAGGGGGVEGDKTKARVTHHSSILPGGLSPCSAGYARDIA